MLVHMITLMESYDRCYSRCSHHLNHYRWIRCAYQRWSLLEAIPLILCHCTITSQTTLGRLKTTFNIDYHAVCLCLSVYLFLTVWVLVSLLAYPSACIPTCLSACLNDGRASICAFTDSPTDSPTDWQTRWLPKVITVCRRKQTERRRTEENRWVPNDECPCLLMQRDESNSHCPLREEAIDFHISNITSGLCSRPFYCSLHRRRWAFEWTWRSISSLD